jgi:4-amino-4-deoxy-L-arabinose transferase-like glycosyltransferase
MTTSESAQNPVFDYRTLRLVVGIVAFALPVVVWLISSRPLSSISASYHTEARNVFVGALFIIAALFLAYNGHTPIQKWVSKGAAPSAILVAICPTSCYHCDADPIEPIISTIHYVAAVILFLTIAYFCLGPFRKNTKGQKGKKGRRAIVYLVCGWIIVVCMLAVGVTTVLIRKEMAITFVAEFVALWAFGVAWIVAGKVIPPLVDKEERLILWPQAE